MGSLTTPPCTEGVVWTVYQQVFYSTSYSYSMPLNSFSFSHMINVSNLYIVMILIIKGQDGLPVSSWSIKGCPSSCKCFLNWVKLLINPSRIQKQLHFLELKFEFPLLTTSFFFFFSKTETTQGQFNHWIEELSYSMIQQGGVF